MLLLWVALLLAGFAVAEHHEIPNVSIKIDPASTFVMFGTRHGNRNPEEYLKENPRNDPKIWGFEGATELTSIGKRQAYGLGKAVREFVGNKVSNNYLPSEAKYYSSSANRCQMTLQTAVAGIHTPEAWGDWNTKSFDSWSPIPYTIDDPMLRMYAVSKCVNNKEAWAPIDTDTMPSLAKVKQDKKELLDYMHQNTGWDMSNLGKAADVADNLIEIQLYNATLPTWISNPTLKGYTGKTMQKAILDFAEIHQNACAELPQCGNLMAAYWLWNVLDTLKKTSTGESKTKLIGYASHTEVTLSLMKLLGIDKDELTTSAGFVIEYKPTPVPSVRLLNHDPNPIDNHVIYSAKYVPALQSKADSNGFIKLSDFTAFASPKAVKDWENQCGIDYCKKG